MIPRFKCLNPIPLTVDFLFDVNIESPNSKKNLNSGKIFTDHDKMADYLNRKQGNILAPCGKCFNCRKSRVNEWFIRYVTETTTNYSDCLNLFVTLTYEKIENPSLEYRDVQLFLKRLRKYYKDYKLKFLCVGEYGFQSDRKHWHLIIIGFKELPNNYKQVITHLWNKGFTMTKICDENTIYYLLKYSFKSFHKNSDYYKSKGLKLPMFRCSQGFGKDFALKNKERILKDNVLSYNGFKYRVPRYFIKLYRKIRLLDGWTILANSIKSTTNYCTDVLKYFRDDFDYGSLVKFDTFYSLKRFKEKVKDFFVDINKNLYYNFFNNEFKELL